MRLRFLLQPGWISMILVGLVFAGISFSVLAPWQFRRDAERNQQNSAIQSSFTATPVPLDQVLGPTQAPDGRTEWRTVTLTGRYLPQDETVARLRSVLTEPAYEVLTPLRLTDGSVALVDRGFIRQSEGTSVPSFAPAPAGQVTVTARVRQDEVDPKHRDVITLSGTRQVYTIDSHTVARGTTLPIRPGYYELTDGQPGVLAALPLPELDAGPFFAYAVQWLIFGGFAIFGIGYLIWQELNPESDDLDLADFDEGSEFDEAVGRDADLDGTGPSPPTTAAQPGTAQPDTAASDAAEPGHTPATTAGDVQVATSAPPPPAVPADRYGRRR